MASQDKNQNEGKNTVSLKEYFDSLREADQIAVQAALASAEKAVAAALTASEKAVDKAETAQGKVNQTQNEFRGALKDQAATLMPRSEYNINHKALEEKVNTLTARMNQDKGGEISMGKIYAAIGAVGAILGIIVMLANGVFK
jgi:flagellar motor component MotA